MLEKEKWMTANRNEIWNALKFNIGEWLLEVRVYEEKQTCQDKWMNEWHGG